MQWWNDLIEWIQSDDGWRVITGGILPFLAILIGGLIAGGVARGATKRLMQQQDRQHKAAAVAALIAVGRRAAVWHTLSAAEKEHVDAQASEAEIRVRLIALPGADLAAEWAEVQLASMKKNSAAFSFQAEQDLQDYQNGLIAWQAKPAKARKLFAQDLAAWKYDDGSVDRDLLERQQVWSAEHDGNDETAVLPKAAAGKA
jgi:hypothetical protein